MGTTSTVNGLPAPAGGDGNDVASHLLALVAALDTGSVVKRLTSTQIAALTSAQKPAGLVVYNTTTGRLQVSNGSTFDDYVKAQGAWTPYAPVVEQGGTTITSTNNESAWVQTDRTVTARVDVTITGTSGSDAYVYVSLPVQAADFGGTAGGGMLGTVMVSDYSETPGMRLYVAWITSGTSRVWVLPHPGVSVFALAPGDRIAFSVTYEAAS